MLISAGTVWIIKKKVKCNLILKCITFFNIMNKCHFYGFGDSECQMWWLKIEKERARDREWSSNRNITFSTSLFVILHKAPNTAIVESLVFFFLLSIAWIKSNHQNQINSVKMPSNLLSTKRNVHRAQFFSLLKWKV